MKLHSLLLMGVGLALACTFPAFAAGTSTPPDVIETAVAGAQKANVLEASTPKADTATVKKPKVKSTAKKANDNKKVAKAKKKPAAEQAEEQKPKSLFASLFGGGIKSRSDDDKAKAKAKVPPAPVQAKQQPKPVEELEPIDASFTSNNGELRSAPPQEPDLFASLFGNTPKQTLLPQTRALDTMLEKKQSRSSFRVKPAFEPQEVEFSGYTPGTIVIDTDAKFLYLVEDRSTARRYAIAVGREGLQFKGSVTVGDKQEWPRWIPTKEMQQRDPRKYGQYKDGMDGGTENPLGARAIYLYQGKKDTHLRIHGTNQPQSIGTSASNGCFRMINDHVMDLYTRVKVGTPVVVL